MKCKLYLIGSLGIVLMVFNGCKKKELPEALPIINQWEEYGSLKGREKVLLNGIASGDHFYALSPSYFHVLKDESSDLISYAGMFHNYSLDETPPMAENFIILRGSFSPYATLSFYSLPLDRHTDLTPIDVDSSCMYIERSNILINNRKQGLIPYRDSNGIYKYFLTDLKDDFYTKGRVVEAQNSRIYGLAGHTIDNNFFVSQDQSTFKITPDGNTYNVLNALLSDIFKINEDVLIGIGVFGSIFTSTNNGDNWTSFSPNPWPDLARLKFKRINDNVLGFYDSQIYLVTLTNDGGRAELTLKELENKGLENTEITSISLFKNHYYVTTYNGLFRKHMDDFFSLK